MATNIGDLRINLSAETAAFSRDLNKAKGELKQASYLMSKNIGDFQASMGAAKEQLLGFATAAVSAAGVIGIGALIKSSLESAVAIEKNAKQAGVGVEAFQELEYAASKYHVTTEALTDGLKELALRGDEFALTGKGSAAEAFERLGFTTQDVNERLADTPALLSEVITRMEGLDKASQIRISDEIFGGQGGEQFVAMIQGGSLAMEELRREARELGIVLDEDLIHNSDKASKNLDSLQKMLSAHVTRAIVSLAPEIVGLTEKLIGSDDAISDFKAGMEGIGTAVKGVVGAGVVAKNTLELIGKTLAAGAAQFVSLAQGDFTGAQAIGDQWVKDAKGDLADVMALFDVIDARASQRMGAPSSSGVTAGPAAGGRNSGNATTDDLKNQVAMIKQIFAELQTEQKEAVSLNKEMYEQLGTGAETVAKDEVVALMERAAKWKAAGAEIADINEWLYARIEEMRVKWAERGEQEAAEYLDSFSVHRGSLIDEYTQLQEAAVAELNKIGVRMDLLDKQDITLDIYLRDHVTAQINALMAKIQTLQATASGLSYDMGGGMSGPGWGPPITTTRIISNNYNQALSRSDVVNISTEQERLGNRN